MKTSRVRLTAGGSWAKEGWHKGQPSRDRLLNKQEPSLAVVKGIDKIQI